MTVDGKEITSCSTQELLKNRKLHGFLFFLALFFLIGGGIAAALMLLQGEDFDMLLPFLMFAVIFVGTGVRSGFLLRSINTELKRREISEHDHAAEKKFSKKMWIFVVCVFAGIIIASLFAPHLFSTQNNGGCRNCGRDTTLVPGFDFCYDCYGGFSDWQKDNWAKDD